MFFAHEWHNFCTTTGIKAFAFLYHSKTLSERLFWLITLTAGFALTMWDVSTTISTFRANPTVTKVTVEPNKTFKLDNALICLLQTMSGMKSYGVNISNSGEVADLLNEFDSVNLTNYFVSGLRNLSRSQGNLGKTDSRFPQMLYLSSIMLANLMRVELVENDMYTTKQMPWGIALGKGHDAEAAQSLQLVHRLYQKQTHSHRETIKFVAASIWCMTGLYVHSSQSFYHLPVENHCQPEVISWFGQLPLDNDLGTSLLNCFTVSPKLLTFRSTRDTISVGFDSSRVQLLDPFTYFGVYVGPEPVLTEESQNVLYIQEAHGHMVNIRMVGHYKSLPSKESMCANTDHSYFDCLLNCRADYIQKYCGCEPLFSVFLPQNRKQKNACGNALRDWSDSYEIFPYTSTEECRNLSKTLVRKSCESECFEPCERKMFQLVAKDMHSQPIHENETVQTKLWIFMDSFVYSMFEETVLLDSKQFLSQLGGNLSFWLGASFLALLHVIVFLVKLPFVHAERRAVQAEENLEKFSLGDIAQEQKPKKILKRNATVPIKY